MVESTGGCLEKQRKILDVDDISSELEDIKRDMKIEPDNNGLENDRGNK